MLHTLIDVTLSATTTDWEMPTVGIHRVSHKLVEKLAECTYVTLPQQFYFTYPDITVLSPGANCAAGNPLVTTNKHACLVQLTFLTRRVGWSQGKLHISSTKILEKHCEGLMTGNVLMVTNEDSAVIKEDIIKIRHV